MQGGCKGPADLQPAWHEQEGVGAQVSGTSLGGMQVPQQTRSWRLLSLCDCCCSRTDYPHTSVTNMLAIDLPDTHLQLVESKVSLNSLLTRLERWLPPRIRMCCCRTRGSSSHGAASCGSSVELGF